jgi:hypothetical protein
LKPFRLANVNVDRSWLSSLHGLTLDASNFFP